MKTHIVIDGNAFYEVDEDCLRKMQEQRKKGGPGDIRIHSGDGPAEDCMSLGERARDRRWR